MIPKSPCEKCPLNGNTQVLLDGSLDKAKILFVGEAPGEYEVEQKQPFVGESGRLLKGILRSELLVEYEDMAFANVCRCRPPMNKTPTDEAIACCMKLLKEEIKGFDGLIVLLGGTALSAFVRRTGVMRSAGYGFFEDGQKYFSTYHPAFILRNPKYGDYFKDDLRKVANHIHNPPKIDYEFVRTLAGVQECVREIHKASMPFVSFDIETSGVYPWTAGAEIFSIALTLDENRTWFIPLRHPESPLKEVDKEVMAMMDILFSDPKIKTIAHSGKFDMNWLKWLYGIETINYYFDTKIAQYLLMGTWYPTGLKSCAWRYTDYGGYDIDVTNLKETPLKVMADYNALDAFIEWRLCQILGQELTDMQHRLLTGIICPAIMAVGEMEREGMKVDRERLAEFLKQYSDELQELEVKLHSHKEVEEIEKEKQATFNFKSPKQLVGLLEKMGTVPKFRTEKGAISTKEEALKTIQKKNPIIKDLLTYRGKGKMKSTYLTPVGERLEIFQEDVLHGEYMFGRTTTGRLACKKPNFQNQPFEIRSIYISKYDWMLEVDYSQLELRVLAMETGDKELVKCYLEGKDIHEETRQAIEEYIPTKEKQDPKKERRFAKDVNFGIVYQISAYGLAERLGISTRAAQKMIDAFYERFSGVKEWVNETEAFVLRHGYVETMFGRKRRFRITSDMPEKDLAAALREAVNTPIQSAARDLVFDAEGRMWREMRAKSLKSCMIADIHDAVLFDVIDEELEIMLKSIPEVMEKFEFDFVTVPIKVDISYGTHWGELKEF